MKNTRGVVNCVSRIIAGLFVCAASVGMAHAGVPVYEIEIREHLFYPAELTIPAGKKVKLLVLNQDATPEEFESFELNREKVIMGKRKAVIFIGPLHPGRYPYFGEFHPETAQGIIIAE